MVFPVGERAVALAAQREWHALRYSRKIDLSISRPASILAEFPNHPRFKVDRRRNGGGEGWAAHVFAPRGSARGQNLTFTLSLSLSPPPPLSPTPPSSLWKPGERPAKTKGRLNYEKTSFYINLLFIDDSNLLFFSSNDSTLNSIHNSTIRNLSTPSRRPNPLFPSSLPPCHQFHLYPCQTAYTNVPRERYSDYIKFTNAGYIDYSVNLRAARKAVSGRRNRASQKLGEGRRRRSPRHPRWYPSHLYKKHWYTKRSLDRH